MEKEKILKRLQEHYDELLKTFDEDQVFFVALVGSQNYLMSDSESDIDSKAIVLPSLEDLAFNREAKSYTHILENDEHIDVKDIRLMFQLYRKQNIQYLETLFTEYVIVNPKYKGYWDKLQANRETIARYDQKRAMKAMCGMVGEKDHALTHRYPSRAQYIDRYGYDGKQLSHAMRVFDFMQRYANNEPYINCLIPRDRERIMAIKRHDISLPVEEAVRQSADLLRAAKQLSDTIPDGRKNCLVDMLLDQVQIDILLDFFKAALKKRETN